VDVDFALEKDDMEFLDNLKDIVKVIFGPDKK